MRDDGWNTDALDDEAPQRALGTREEARLLAELRTLYRQADEAYAPFSCAASGECCQLAVTRRQPWLWAPEWRLLAKGRPLPPPRADGACPYLDAAGKRCTAYADRPFGCRTFFCARIQGPARQPLEAVVALMKRLEQLSERLDPELAAPRELLDWHAEARDATRRGAPPDRKP